MSRVKDNNGWLLQRVRERNSLAPDLIRVLSVYRTCGLFHGYPKIKHAPGRPAHLEGKRSCAKARLLLSFLDDSRSVCPDG